MEKRKETVNDKVEKQAEDLEFRTIHQSGWGVGGGGGRNVSTSLQLKCGFLRFVTRTIGPVFCKYHMPGHFIDRMSRWPNFGTTENNPPPI